MSVTLRITACLVLLTLASACASPARSARGIGSEHTHRFQQPPEKAARCFAHNAQEHSSALMSEVRVSADGSAEVIVRVKNGVMYASADFNRAGNASTGTIRLMVTTSRGTGGLLESLVEGC